MNLDEFAFFNHQLGRMLQDGVPLEGALRRLCQHMRRGPTRAELEALGRDLEAGRPLDAALADRRLPDLYVRLLRLGARSDSLPDLLLLIADHYQRVSSLWTRLKGLLVYPVLVLIAALGLSIHISRVLHEVCRSAVGIFEDAQAQVPGPWSALPTQLVLPPAILSGLLLVGLACLGVPALRRRLRWRVPAFQDAALARLASVLSLLLRGGATLAEALDLAREMEGRTGAAKDLARWTQRLAEGHSRFADIALVNARFPKLFVWLVDSAGEDLAGGFAHAAEIYHERASHRAEMALHGLLPVAILMLGLMLYSQAYTIMASVLEGIEQLTYM